MFKGWGRAWGRPWDGLRGERQSRTWARECRTLQAESLPRRWRGSPISCKFRWFRSKWQECVGFFCSECFLFVLLPCSFQYKGCTDGRSALRLYPLNLLRIMPAKEWLMDEGDSRTPAGAAPAVHGGDGGARLAMHAQGAALLRNADGPGGWHGCGGTAHTHK